MTISFSYAYLKGFDRFIVSTPSVQIAVHRPNLAMSPLITGKRYQHKNLNRRRKNRRKVTYCS